MYWVLAQCAGLNEEDFSECKAHDERGPECTQVHEDRVRRSNTAIGKIIELGCFGLYGQVTKRIRWMPRQQEAMKDVAVCEKLR